MSDGFRRFKEDLVWKVRDTYAKWERLPMATKGAVATVLVIAAAAALTAAYYFTFANKGETQANAVGGEVTLYTSTDAYLIAPITTAFELETGIRVRVVGDTEATKTTGLIERLLLERDKPSADVWWSNEALGSAMLAERGVLEAYLTKAEADFQKGWPADMRDPERRWYGFALRARVIAFNTNRVSKANAPTRLRDLTASQWAGRVGMARPQFGTTRMFVAWLVAAHGREAAREYLGALKAAGLRLYDGNSAVVQGLSNGEIDIGLTDTDDVFAAKRNSWPVDFVYEALEKPTAVSKGQLRSIGPLVIPNTVGVVRGRPHPNEAGKLANFLLSAKVERMLAESDSRNLPLREALAKDFKDQQVKDPSTVPMGDIARALVEADALIAELFSLP